MKVAIQEKVMQIKDALTRDSLVFIRVSGGRNEYSVTHVRSLQQTLEFELGVGQSLIVAPEELGVVRIVENGNG